jgi:hypothetical protein
MDDKNYDKDNYLKVFSKTNRRNSKFSSYMSYDSIGSDWTCNLLNEDVKYKKENLKNKIKVF